MYRLRNAPTHTNRDLHKYRATAKEKQSFDWLSPSFSYHPCVFVRAGLHRLGSCLGPPVGVGPCKDSTTPRPQLYKGVMIGSVQTAINTSQAMVPEY